MNLPTWNSLTLSQSLRVVCVPWKLWLRVRLLRSSFNCLVAFAENDASRPTTATSCFCPTSGTSCKSPSCCCCCAVLRLLALLAAFPTEGPPKDAASPLLPLPLSRWEARNGRDICAAGGSGLRGEGEDRSPLASSSLLLWQGPHGRPVSRCHQVLTGEGGCWLSSCLTSRAREVVYGSSWSSVPEDRQKAPMSSSTTSSAGV